MIRELGKLRELIDRRNLVNANRIRCAARLLVQQYFHCAYSYLLRYALVDDLAYAIFFPF